MNTKDAEQLIIQRYNETGDYTEMYRQYDRFSTLLWAEKDRPTYQADLWYNLNRNEICLEMLADICNDKDVLSVGGGQWVEAELLKAIKAKTIARSDIIGGDGFIEADVCALPFENHSYDVVICRELIEHVLDHNAAFREIKRVLRAHGYLLITTPNIYAMLTDGTFHVRAYSPLGLLYKLEQQGYRILKKRGNLPYILIGLMYYSHEFPKALEDFKEIDRITRNDENLYYLSTQLFVLAQKVGNE